MFNNIGVKIKNLAYGFFVLGIVGSVCGAVVLFCNGRDMVIAGIAVLVGGVILSLLWSFCLYGFGQLIENTDILVVQGEERPSWDGGYFVPEKGCEVSSEKSVDTVFEENGTPKSRG